MKAYLLVYGRELGTRPNIKSCLNNLPEVITWRSEMPNSFFILSDTDAVELGEAIAKCVGVEAPRFLVTEIPQTPRRWGWLSTESWNFIKRGVETDSDEDSP